MLIKKKYEKIECSNNHIFSIDYDGVIKKWNCVVLENEVVSDGSVIQRYWMDLGV